VAALTFVAEIADGGRMVLGPDLEQRQDLVARQ
jgi:hypothetical protein